MGDIIICWFGILFVYSFFVALVGDEHPIFGIIWGILALPLLIIIVPIVYFVCKMRKKNEQESTKDKPKSSTVS